VPHKINGTKIYNYIPYRNASKFSSHFSIMAYFLTQKKFLKVTNLGNKNYFHTTVRGLRYLREFNELKKVLLE